ncbi:DUF721 domain-containing protein [Lysobacter sp. HDW10]|uniref:DciA family protein n=1 Tax=Lysobacter sp. HDW10 TaxID=2714936 RepID=UPI001409ACDD|nr:DciA family protein [Lysobacter sp. HDW10]QIK80360.1 DUF721 domain-containing protein [Lysobacter sp. HDW10]
MSSRNSFGSGSPPRRTRKPPRNVVDVAMQSALADPLRRAAWLGKVGLQLSTALPRELVAHARFANIEGRTLVYLVDGPVWANRLRLSAEPIIASARSVGLDVEALKVRVARNPFPLPPSVGNRAQPPVPATERTALRTIRHLLADAQKRGQSSDDS